MSDAQILFLSLADALVNQPYEEAEKLRLRLLAELEKEGIVQ